MTNNLNIVNQKGMIGGSIIWLTGLDKCISKLAVLNNNECSLSELYDEAAKSIADKYGDRVMIYDNEEKYCLIRFEDKLTLIVWSSKISLESMTGKIKNLQPTNIVILRHPNNFSKAKFIRMAEKCNFSFLTLASPKYDNISSNFITKNVDKINFYGLDNYTTDTVFTQFLCFSKRKSKEISTKSNVLNDSQNNPNLKNQILEFLKDLAKEVLIQLIKSLITDRCQLLSAFM